MPHRVKQKRKPSQYNMFMSKHIRLIKSENPELDSKTVFSQAVGRWRQQKQRGGGTLGDVGTGLMAAGGLTAATGIGAAAVPFLEAAGGLAKGADWVAGLF